MFTRKIQRGFKNKTEALQNSLESAYDLLNHRSYFHMLGNITRRVSLYNAYVTQLENNTDEKAALEYLQALNGSQKYQEALIFASKFKYSWTTSLRFNSSDGEVIIRPISDKFNRKKFKEQVTFANEKLGNTLHRSLLLYNLISCITFLILVFPGTTLEWLFWAKKTAEEGVVTIQDKIEGKLKVNQEQSTIIEKDLGKKVYFKDVIGIDEFKDELMEIVDYLKNPEKYEQMGAYVPKGVLQIGRASCRERVLMPV